MPTSSGTLAGLRLSQYDTTSELKVEGAFVAVGHDPNTKLLSHEGVKLDEAGYVITIPGSMRTSVVGLYAAGDVQDPIYRQAVTSAGTGAMAALDAERWLCEHGC
jgi:thioredoxin reductase (NADPH)